jgi:hypothetical protein
MAFETAEGAQPPLGFFDPLGLLKDADQARFDQLRFVELKHGRIAMLGVLGHLVQQNYRFPGYIDLEGFYNIYSILYLISQSINQSII